MGEVCKVLGVSALVLVVVGAALAPVSAQGEGGNATKVSEQSGKITFNTETHAVGASPKSYDVPYEHQLELTLDLDVNGSGEAEFATPPVRFPHGDPPSFRWRKVSATQIVLTELNNNKKPGQNDEYFFKARISFGGETYESPDPTIINIGPPPE